MACRRGLDALDIHRATLGSSELRALATGYGADLAGLALAHAVARAAPHLPLVERTLAGDRPGRAAGTTGG